MNLGVPSGLRNLASVVVAWLADLDVNEQELSLARLPHDEEEQPNNADPAERCTGNGAESICEIWYACYHDYWPGEEFAERRGACSLLINTAERGQEKSESLEGLSDKQIEDTVSGLVRAGLS
jgi:hypothetical protein